MYTIIIRLLQSFISDERQEIKSETVRWKGGNWTLLVHSSPRDSLYLACNLRLNITSDMKSDYKIVLNLTFSFESASKRSHGLVDRIDTHVFEASACNKDGYYDRDHDKCFLRDEVYDRIINDGPCFFRCSMTELIDISRHLSEDSDLLRDMTLRDGLKRRSDCASSSLKINKILFKRLKESYSSQSVIRAEASGEIVDDENATVVDESEDGTEEDAGDDDDNDDGDDDEDKEHRDDENDNNGSGYDYYDDGGGADDDENDDDCDDYDTSGPLNSADDDDENYDNSYGTKRTNRRDLQQCDKDNYIGIDPVSHSRYAYVSGGKVVRVRFELRIPPAICEKRQVARENNYTFFKSLRSELTRGLKYFLSKSQSVSTPVIRPIVLDDGCIRTCCIRRTHKVPFLLSGVITNLCNRCFQPFSDDNISYFHSHKVHISCQGACELLKAENILDESSSSCRFCGFHGGVVEYFSRDAQTISAHWFCAHFNEKNVQFSTGNTIIPGESSVSCVLCSKSYGIINRCPVVACSVRAHPICALSSGWCCTTLMMGDISNTADVLEKVNKESQAFLCCFHAQLKDGD